MAQVCSSCQYFDTDGDQHNCPECGTELQFTMLGQINSDPDTDKAIEDAWTRPPDIEVETLEQPVGVRFAQIGSAVFFFYIGPGIAGRFLAFCFADVLTHPDAKVVLGAMAIISLVLCLGGALVAGAIAGAWSVNWVPQGVGVAIGIWLPMFLLALFLPLSGVLVAMLIIVLLTTPVTVLGAYLGHVLMKPSRFIHS